jgi:ubiquinone/menaquinone biosynthesis C-methylase UbiE
MTEKLFMAHIFDERLNVNPETKQFIIYDEHLVRYEFAKRFVKGKKVLDIACGSGYGAKILAEAGAEKVIAVDIDKEAVAAAKINYFHKNIEYLESSAEEIKLADKSIDIIVSFETIEHLKNPERYLNELKRVVKDGGTVIISTPNDDVFHAKNPFHFKEYNKDEFGNLLKKYFRYCEIFDQANGIASYIKIDRQNKNGKIFIAENKENPLYFIAVCSNGEIIDLPKDNMASVNPAALHNLYNNPGLKAVNKVYSLIIKIPGVLKIINKIK